MESKTYEVDMKNSASGSGFSDIIPKIQVAQGGSVTGYYNVYDKHDYSNHKSSNDL